MSGIGLVLAVPQRKPLRGWQWTTAVAGVLTVLAAKQVCAATLTVRHTGSADRPVCGLRM